MKTKTRVLLTGATGLVGTKLSLALLAKGYQIVIVGRHDESHFRKECTLPCEYYQWAEPTLHQPPPEALNVDAVINLMGEPLADKRWTAKQKKKIYDSRILSTRNLVTALHKHQPSLHTFVSASAIGYYGEGGDTIFTEKSPVAQDFLGTLCKDWESEAEKSPGRVVLIRTGIAFSDNGGALDKMIPLFENGVGGKLSNGRQWMSWIHVDDLVRIYEEALENQNMKGPYNAVASEPVTNQTFTDLFAKQLKVKAYFTVPKIALNLAMGEMAQVLLASQRVKCEALEHLGFSFKFSNLKAALEDLFGWKETCHDRIYQSVQWVPHARKSVFPFFSDEKNLEALTPEFLHFHVLNKSSDKITEGTVIDYKLKIHGIPAKWKTRITSWKPDHEFKDLQLSGPYKKWDHTHTFEELAGGTLLKDRVVYRLPLASLGGNVALPFVAKDIKEIFKFRRKKIKELFK